MIIYVDYIQPMYTKTGYKQKTPRMWGLIAVTNYFSLVHYNTYWLMLNILYCNFILL